MSALVVLSVSVLTLHSVISISSLSKPELPFTSTNVKPYVIKLCHSFRDFFHDQGKVKSARLQLSDGEAFEAVWGQNTDFFDDASVVKFDGRSDETVRGYREIKVRACIIRNLASFSPGDHGRSCTTANWNDLTFTANSLTFSAYHTTHLLSSSDEDHQEYTKWEFRFDNETGCIVSLIPNGNTGYPSTLFELGFQITTTTMDIAAYLGLIEEQVVGTNENIAIMTRMMWFIIMLVALLCAATIALSFNKLKYSAVNLKDSNSEFCDDA